MTVHAISSHTLDGSEVWGPYTAPDGAAWIKAKVSTPVHADTSYLRMFLEPFHFLIERSLDGAAWEHYGSAWVYGDDFNTSSRDSWNPAQLWVSINADGYQYRVTATTSYSQVISGEVEFDTDDDRPTIDVGSSNIEIADYVLMWYYGPGGHGTGPVREFTTPIIDPRTDNPAIIVLTAEHVGLYLYPDQCPTLAGDEISTGDHKKVKWGLDGPEVPRVLRAGAGCFINVPAYVQTGLPNEKQYLHVDFYPDDPDGWLSGGTPPEEREIALPALVMCAVLVCSNVDQSNPVYATWESSAINTPIGSMPEPPFDGGSIGFNTNLASLPGQLLFGSGITVKVSDAPPNPHPEPSAGATELMGLTPSWFQDYWAIGCCYRAASAGSTTLIGEELVYAPEYTSGAVYGSSAALALNETLYCHMVAVETPADPNDLPDADQVRAGTDGFDAAAVDAQSRGPDENGTVTFDPFTGADPNTDYTLCFVWEDEDEIVTYELTTLGAIYHVAVETPVDDLDLPNKEQIKAGTDGFDIAALDAQTKPAVSGTVAFDAFSGASPGTDYTLCFVYDNEDPVYYDLTTLVFNPFLARNCNVIIGVAA